MHRQSGKSPKRNQENPRKAPKKKSGWTSPKSKPPPPPVLKPPKVHAKGVVLCEGACFLPSKHLPSAFHETSPSRSPHFRGIYPKLLAALCGIHPYFSTPVLPRRQLTFLTGTFKSMSPPVLLYTCTSLSPLTFLTGTFENMSPPIQAQVLNCFSTTRICRHGHANL